MLRNSSTRGEKQLLLKSCVSGVSFYAAGFASAELQLPSRAALSNEQSGVPSLVQNLLLLDFNQQAESIWCISSSPGLRISLWRGSAPRSLQGVPWGWLGCSQGGKPHLSTFLCFHAFRLLFSHFMPQITWKSPLQCLWLRKEVRKHLALVIQVHSWKDA